MSLHLYLDFCRWIAQLLGMLAKRFRNEPDAAAKELAEPSKGPDRARTRTKNSEKRLRDASRSFIASRLPTVRALFG